MEIGLSSGLKRNKEENGKGMDLAWFRLNLNENGKQNIKIWASLKWNNINYIPIEINLIHNKQD